ncbi:MAG: tetratricopeptide repeat protein [Kiloniellales bacterium]|nr:tetratricopeptide repeat protein [Kiloniellales bacterium]
MSTAAGLDGNRRAALAVAAALLFLPPAAAAEITDCDRLAADPWDTRRLIVPQALTEANAAEAVAACRRALAAQPEAPRLKLQLGRALLFQGFPVKALEPLSEAAESDYAAAEFYLGLAYERQGWDGHDPAAARTHYEKAAALGHAQGQHKLALALLSEERGDGARLRAALPWLERAAAQSLAEALYLQGVLYSNGGYGLWPDLERAAALFGEAVALGHDASRLALGNAFVMGRGVEKDPQHGLELITRAAENGFPSAQIELGRMYLSGRVVERDEERGYQWFCKAEGPGQALFFTEYGKPLPCNDL